MSTHGRPSSASNARREWPVGRNEFSREAQAAGWKVRSMAGFGGLLVERDGVAIDTEFGREGFLSADKAVAPAWRVNVATTTDLDEARAWLQAF